MSPLLAHTAISLALIVAYIVVTVTGNSGNEILGGLLGYLGGGGVATGIEKSNGGSK